MPSVVEGLPSSKLLHGIANEVVSARQKFPTNKHNLAAMLEEAGEVANALLEFENGNKTEGDVVLECVQLAAMAIRIAEEGSAEFSFQGVNLE